MNIDLKLLKPEFIAVGMARKEWKGLVQDLTAAKEDGQPLDEDLLNACQRAGRNYQQLCSELVSSLVGYCPELFEPEEGTEE